MEDAQYRREEAIACVRLWEAALQLYIEDCCYTSVDGINPAGWDDDEAYNDLYGSNECLDQLLAPFDFDTNWMAGLIKARVEAFKANHVEDDQMRLLR